MVTTCLKRRSYS